MYIPLDSSEAGMGQRFLTAHPDIQNLRDAWAEAIYKKDWALAALYQLDIEKRRDQMVMFAIEQAANRVCNAIGIYGTIIAATSVVVLYFTRH
jgi:hypothetical protein